MNNTELFGWISIGAAVLPAAVAAGLFLWLPVRSLYGRLSVAVVAAWILAVAYTMYVYNPAGVLAGHEQGVHFPEARYDNNTITVALLAGWFWPLIAVLIVWLARRVFRTRRGRI